MQDLASSDLGGDVQDLHFFHFYDLLRSLYHAPPKGVKYNIGVSADPRVEAMRRVLETERVEMHTSLPGRVQSYNAGAQTADIELGASEVLPSGDDDTPDEPRSFPILTGVPVVHLRGGGYFIHVPLEVGDTGIVLFLESSPGPWRSGDGSAADPGTGARHSLSGAVFVPGLHLENAGLSGGDRGTGLALGREGGPKIECQTAEIRVGGSNTLAEAEDVKTHLNLISTQIATLCAAVLPTPLAPSYVYAAVLAGAPIETTITKGT